MSAPAFQTLTLRTIASGYIPDPVYRLTRAAAVREFKARTLGPLALACLLVAAPASAQVNYVVSGSTAYVTRSPNASGDVVIASTFNGYPVTSIGVQAFSGCTSMTSVTIPNSVTKIGVDSFSSCYVLKNLTIPNSVTSIGYLAFYNCVALTNVTMGNGMISIGPSAFVNCGKLVSVNIPYGVTSIGDSAFDDCTSLTGVTIPGSVISIGSGAFWNCTSLRGVMAVPDSVTSIGGYAFYGNAGLMSVTIGNGVTNIGNWAFHGCTSLTNISVDAANPAYTGPNGVLFDKAQTTLITHPAARADSYVIPGSVTSIGVGAFVNGRLTSVTIPEGVTSIAAQAFQNCTALTSVTIPNSVTRIGDSLYSGTGGNAFQNCTSLTNVIIGNSVTNIGYSAFYGCTNLTRVTIGNSVAKIGAWAFGQCRSATNFTFLGNAPALVYDIEAGGGHFYGVGAGAKAYYYCGTTGWGTGYGGMPTVMLCPPQVAPGSAGVKPGGFGFTLTRLTNQTIVVEASTNLVNWQPIWTNSPPGASVDFVDSEWLNHSDRFYRARSDNP